MGRERTRLIATAAIAATAVAIWSGLNASAEADRLRELANELRRQISEIQLALDDTQSERNDFRVQASDLGEQLHAACSRHGRLAPRVSLNPSTGPVETRVRIHGRCFIEDFNDRDQNPRYFALVGRPEPGQCERVSALRGRVHIDGRGILEGHFVVAKTADGCRETQKLQLRPGRYRLVLGCRTCDIATFEVTRRPYWWIDSAAIALKYVAKRVEAPVALPPLPTGTHLDVEYPIRVEREDGATSITINLRWDEGRWLQLSYGSPSIWVDGCEPPKHRVVEVNGQRALITKRRLGLEPPGEVWSTIVWPVAPGSLVGRYGIAGSFGPKRALELARAMDLAISTAPTEVEKSC